MIRGSVIQDCSKSSRRAFVTANLLRGQVKETMGGEGKPQEEKGKRLHNADSKFANLEEFRTWVGGNTKTTIPLGGILGKGPGHCQNVRKKRSARADRPEWRDK